MRLKGRAESAMIQGLRPARARRKGNFEAHLIDLEQYYAAVLAAGRRPSEAERSERLMAKVRAFLASKGVAQQASESLMDALARAVGMTSHDLREYLKQRALGVVHG